ncbi:MAG: glycoside hydrolase family 16 protein [Chlorobi bacterium]|nr:glycoside hydrolase family 16 protein [Chlorobiota bacterium]
MPGLFGTLLGSKFPDTQKYELKIKNLKSDYKRYQDYENSSFYKRYLELDKLIHSGDFEKKVKKLKNEKFKDTDQYRKYKNFKTLSKSKDIKSFFKFKNSGYPERIDKILSSEEYQRYIELKNFIESPAFREAKSTKGFKKSPEYKKLKEFKRLKKSSDIRFINKTLSSASFKNYERMKSSKRLKNYNELEQYVNSKEFLDFKSYMEDPKRFKKSEEYGLINEYEDIKKTPDFIWYTKTKKHNNFDDLNKWQLTFSDEFDGSSLDTDKWITGYFWGKALMNQTYVLENEKQFFTDKNIELRDSLVKISTKKEKVKGKIWHSKFGFMPADFEYTSGLISTGQSFRQKYGKFEAKVRISDSHPVTHSFWMVAEQNVPQVDILRLNSKSSKKINIGCHYADGKESKNITFDITGANFSNDFYIFTLEWYPDKMIWKINGEKVKELTSNIPQEPMYLVFSSHILEDKEPGNMPASMDIDWVRCYKQNE